MNRVIIINLNGIAYQLEESGYDALRTYLDHAAQRLEGNPDRDEIIADIEQAIADKFRTVLGANKNVVMTREVQNALAEMGPVQDGTGPDSTSAAGKSATNSEAPKDPTEDGGGEKGGEKDSGPVRRLYTINEGAMFFGVCNGLAAFWKIDVTVVRVLFVGLTLMWGTGALIYLIMAMIVPSADTAEEKAAAFGAAATAQEFIRRAKEGYYEGMKSLNDKQARSEWKRKFKQDMRGWGRNFQSEMRRNTQQWQQNWANRWPQPPHGVGPAFAAPILSLIGAVIALVAIFALYSLITSGMVFGISLPAGVPLWVGIVFLLIVWRCVAWPFKAMRWHACYGGCYPGRRGPFGDFGDFIGGLAMAVLFLWLADHYIPQFHHALKQLPPLLHQAIDSVQSWLEKR